MEDLFHKYYLEDDYVISMLRNAVIIFDTSALLDLFYYSDDTQEKICTDVFDCLAGRLWLPAQVYFEFLKNKDKVIGKPIETYKSLIHKDESKDGGHIDKIETGAKNAGKDAINSIKNQLKTLKEKTQKQDKHPYLPVELYVSIDEAIVKIEQDIVDFQKRIDSFSKDFKDAIEQKVNEFVVDGSKVLETLDEKFKLGKEFSFSDMMKLAEEGAFRYQEKIPPGYEDEHDKIGLQKYGDLFVWKQILDIASSTGKDVLLITNDVKEDWIDKENKGPRFELLKEFNSETDHKFWSFNMKDFLYQMNKILDEDQQVSQKVIEEISEVQKQRVSSVEDTLDYTEILQEWLTSDTDIIITEITKDINVNYGRAILYKGINSRGDRCIVLLNVIKRLSFSSCLHAVSHIYNIKARLDGQEDYKYYQFIVALSSKDMARLMFYAQKPSINKIFLDEMVEQNLGYIDEDSEIHILDANHPMG